MPGADKFLQQYCMYCKKIWQSMAEKDLPDGGRLDAEQLLRPQAVTCAFCKGKAEGRAGRDTGGTPEGEKLQLEASAVSGTSADLQAVC